MKSKKSSKGCLGNVVDSLLSPPIKNEKEVEEPATSVDSVNRLVENESSQTKIHSKQKKLKRKV